MTALHDSDVLLDGLHHGSSSLYNRETPHLVVSTTVVFGNQTLALNVLQRRLPIAMPGKRLSVKKAFKPVPVTTHQAFTGIFARERAEAAKARAIETAAIIRTAQEAALAAKASADQLKAEKAREDAMRLTEFMYEHFDVSGFEVHPTPTHTLAF